MDHFDHLYKVCDEAASGSYVELYDFTAEETDECCARFVDGATGAITEISKTNQFDAETVTVDCGVTLIGAQQQTIRPKTMVLAIGAAQLMFPDAIGIDI